MPYNFPGAFISCVFQRASSWKKQKEKSDNAHKHTSIPRGRIPQNQPGLEPGSFTTLPALCGQWPCGVPDPTQPQKSMLLSTAQSADGQIQDGEVVLTNVWFKFKVLEIV